jgi:hypothetical protein
MFLVERVASAVSPPDLPGGIGCGVVKSLAVGDRWGTGRIEAFSDEAAVATPSGGTTASS